MKSVIPLETKILESSIDIFKSNANFLEVAFLLIYGELPNKFQLDKLIFDINENAIIDLLLEIVLKESPPLRSYATGLLACGLLDRGVQDRVVKSNSFFKSISNFFAHLINSIT